MEETPIYFEMVNKTAINKIGNKNIVANTLGLEKKKISIILSITASGYKVKPLMIFKGKKGKTTEKKLQNLEEVKQKMVVVKCQSEAWCDKDIFTSWIDEVFSPYLLFVSKKPGLLILDKATMHDETILLEKLKATKSLFEFIPAGLTRYLQPLDIAVNKTFKDYIKKEYLSLQLENDELTKVKKETLIKWVCKVWYQEEYIKIDTIKKSFLTAGISQKSDGSEDDYFVWPNEIQSDISMDNNYLDDKCDGSSDEYIIE